MCPMWDNDIIYGGEQLEPSVTLDQEYVLWDCAVVAENVTTSLGSDGTKVEVVISACRDDGSGRMLSDPPAKYGTFASSIVAKVRLKGEGDLPAVITFNKVPSKDDSKQDAFVMSFRRRWDGDPATPLPTISAVAAPPVPVKRVDAESGRYYTTVGGRKILGDKAPKREAELARRQALEDENAAVGDFS